MEVEAVEVGGREQGGGGGGNIYFQLLSCVISLSAEILEKTAGGGEWGEPKRKIAVSLQENMLRKRRKVVIITTAL